MKYAKYSCEFLPCLTKKSLAVGHSAIFQTRPTLLLLIPYHPHDRPIDPPEDLDGTFYPKGMEQVPKRLAILRADRYMVDHSDHLIAHVRYGGNSRDLVDHARRRERRGLIRVEEIG